MAAGLGAGAAENPDTKVRCQGAVYNRLCPQGVRGRKRHRDVGWDAHHCALWQCISGAGETAETPHIPHCSLPHSIKVLPLKMLG